MIMQLVVLFAGTVDCGVEARAGPGCINKLAYTKGTEIRYDLGQQGLPQPMLTLKSEVNSELYLTGYADG